MFPATACWVQQGLRADHVAAFDISAACTGFLYGMITAEALIAGGVARRVLLAGSETLTRFTNWEDRNTCVLFGDAAGAAILEASPDDSGILSHYWKADGTLGDLLGLLVVPIGAFYILADGGTLTRNFVEGLPVSWRPMARLLLDEADRSLATYVRGQTLVVLVCSIVAAVVFTALGVRYSLALGVVAGIAEAVPFLGAVAVVGALAIVTSSQGLSQMVIVIAAYVALNQVNNYVINPRLMSSRLELHPFIIILAVLAGSALGGFLGAVLALPVAALLVALGGALWGAGRPETRAK
jgi:predicted PurR-regulated permease PerM